MTNYTRQPAAPLASQDHDNTAMTGPVALTPEEEFLALRRARLASASTAPDVGHGLLPTRVANLVSLATRSTSLAVRVGTTVGGYGLDMAKHTTLSTIELGRTVVGGVLSTAGKDTVLRSAAKVVRPDIEANIERTIDRVHAGVDQLAFWAAAGFNLTSAALSMFSDTTQAFLWTLDRFFGSTDSSRAIASIIALVRRELGKPASTGQVAIGVSELVTAFCALAYLQRSCRALLAEERLRLAVDEIVWDVVVLNNGTRVDVYDETASRQLAAAQAVASDDVSSKQLERWIASSVPESSQVSITREIVTSETIEIHVVGDIDEVRVEAPPGLELVEEHRSRPLQEGDAAASARFVFRHENREEKSMSFQKGNGELTPLWNMEKRLSRKSLESLVNRDGYVGDGSMMLEEETRAVPEPAPSALLAPPPTTTAGPGQITANTSRRREHSEMPLAPPVIPSRMSSKSSWTSPPSPARKERDHSSKSGKRGGLKDALQKPKTIFGNQKMKETNPDADAKNDSDRRSFISIHESLRQSTVSLSETYSIATADGEPSSRVYVESADAAADDAGSEWVPYPIDSPARQPRRMHSFTKNIYTLGAQTSQTSLVSYVYQRKFSPAEHLGTLRRDGAIPGMFPQRHMLANAARYMRFASASYGSKFLKFMGIGTGFPRPGMSDDTHHELRVFAHHTRSKPSDILLASFVDPQGGTDATGATNTGVPMVHYISLDHESKAVVLVCRGTLGFEDVLADMTCDYDDLAWRGRTYKVHKGVHASARRLLYGGDGRVLHTLKAALDEFPDYGLVLTGHSLGAAVTSLLAIMLSEPGQGTGTPFVTSAEPHGNQLTYHDEPAQQPSHICLPANRPIHVYAYGPPATVCPALRRATRGLITTIVNGNDLVPHLSLGLLHDLQATAVALKTDHATAKSELLRRVWQSLASAPNRKGYWSGASAPSSTPAAQSRSSTAAPPPSDDLLSSLDFADDATWSYSTLQSLRQAVSASGGIKLVPPGEVFVVESAPVLRRDAFVAASGAPGPARWWEREENRFGRPARRVVLRYVKDAEKRFGELRFGRGMLTDHSPGRYEKALERLAAGVGVKV
ncbi:hypothetical protein VTJ83DRAFT_1553 [Remersonia thermophila]|uniref:sn-1-specific diacylglycerol lipase n=1 Tax=Remersonia thermophila TaxID=72144 RepID=A0ABR4DIK5_9PEZI